MLEFEENKLSRCRSQKLTVRNSPIPLNLKTLSPANNEKNSGLYLLDETSRHSSLSPSRNPDRRKNFFEMIGLKHVKDKRPDGKISDLKNNSRKISLIDFMGKNKMKFLKKTGFLEYFEEYQRGKGLQKMLEQKQMVSMPNIKHLDKIREYAIKSPTSPKDKKIDLLFKKQKFLKSEREERIGAIEKIILKCDDLYQKTRHGKQSFSRLLMINKEIRIKKKLKVSLHDINMIKRQLK